MCNIIWWLFRIFCILLLALCCFRIPLSFRIRRLVEEESTSMKIWGMFEKENNHNESDQLTELLSAVANATWFLDIKIRNFSKSIPLYKSRHKIVLYKLKS